MRRVLETVDQQAAEQPADGMEPEREVHDDAEVSAAAAERPQKVRVLALACGRDAAVGRYDGRSHEVVEREAVEPDQMPDAAAERQPTYSRVPERSTRSRETMPLARWIEVLPERPAAAGRRPRLRIDDNLAHQAQVDDETPVADAMAGDAVPTAPHGDWKTFLAGERDRGDHVVDVERAGDDLGATVDERVERRPRRVVPDVIRRNHRSAVTPSQLCQRPSVHRRASMNVAGLLNTARLCRHRSRTRFTATLRPRSAIPPPVR